MSRLTLIAAAQRLGISPGSMSILAERSADLEIYWDNGRAWFDAGELDVVARQHPDLLARLRGPRGRPRRGEVALEVFEALGIEGDDDIDEVQEVDE
jgi:hypothetical protein